MNVAALLLLSERKKLGLRLSFHGGTSIKMDGQNSLGIPYRFLCLPRKISLARRIPFVPGKEKTRVPYLPTTVTTIHFRRWFSDKTTSRWKRRMMMMMMFCCCLGEKFEKKVPWWMTLPLSSGNRDKGRLSRPGGCWIRENFLSFSGVREKKDHTIPHTTCHQHQYHTQYHTIPQLGEEQVPRTMKIIWYHTPKMPGGNSFCCLVHYIIVVHQSAQLGKTSGCIQVHTTWTDGHHPPPSQQSWLAQKLFV